MGRPSSYSDEISETICDLLASGLSMVKICERDDMPNRSTVLRWMASNEDFASKSARARELQADLMDDMILDTANACTPETAAADRVKISAYQWRAAKLLPKKYGDKLGIDQKTTIEASDPLMTLLADIASSGKKITDRG